MRSAEKIDCQSRFGMKGRKHDRVTRRISLVYLFIYLIIIIFGDVTLVKAAALCC